MIVSRNSGRSMAGLLSVGALVCSSALAEPTGGRRVFAVEDLLDREWVREPVSFVLEAGEGDVHVDSVRLEGPDGPTACQLGDVELWPGTAYVKTAKLWFVTDLAALERRDYAATHGAEEVETPHPETDLRVDVADDAVEIATSGFGVRLPLGERAFDAPVASAAVPGPVAAMRVADGTWFGGSEMYGETPIRAWSAQLVAAGPVFAEVRYRYAYDDGNVLEGSVRLFARSEVAVFATDSRENRPDNGFYLRFTPGLPPLFLRFQRGMREWVDQPLQAGDARALSLSPWADWFWDTSIPTMRIGYGAQREIRAERRHAGRWVEPAAPGTMRNWSAWQNKRLRFRSDGAGDIHLNFNNAVGERHVQIGDHEPDESVGWKPLRDGLDRPHGAQVKPERLRLNEVLAMVLEWPESDEHHPRLFMSRREVEEMWARHAEEQPEHLEVLIQRGRTFRRGRVTPNYHASQALSAYLASGGDPELARELALADGLRWQLGLLGEWDRMRSSELVASHYDLLIDSGLIDAGERRKLRAQMALVAYQLADPATWSMERGYRSYNPNMTVSYTLALGTVACLLRDHPMAAEWLETPLRMFDRWLETAVTPQGEWGESIAHYAHVSAGDLLSFAIAARRAGLRDFFREERLQKLGLYFAQQYTPRDPRHLNRRVTPPVGRGTAGMAWGHFGVFAFETRDTVPAFSRLMQWMWRETDFATGMVKLGGFSEVYGDRALPCQSPAFGSVRFPNNSVIFRNGFGGPDEHYLHFVAAGPAFGGPHEHEHGSLNAWFAHGRPVSMRFCSNHILYSYMRRLMNQVTPAFSTAREGSRQMGARSGAERDFASFSQVDFASGRYRVSAGREIDWSRLWDGIPEWPATAAEATGDVDWRRQLMWVRGATAEDVHYLVFNDTILNDQPTRWHFWALSEKLDSADAALQPGFLDDAPGNAPSPARELSGNRFTAVGQYGVDLEFFIAEPTDTARHTLRYGGGPHREYAVNITEYQDLLHLQLPGRGRYCAVVAPRREGVAAPEFARLDAGRILRVSGDFGTDYLLLASEAVQAGDAASGVAFDGAAGAVRLSRDGGRSLVLLASGSVGLGDLKLQADGPAQLEHREGAWRLSLDHGGGGEIWKLRSFANWGFDTETFAPLDAITVEIRYPEAGAWNLHGVPGTIPVERSEGLVRFTVPNTVPELEFAARPAAL